MPGSPHNERFMREAIRLARKARGRTRPNPQVGAVVVRRGEIVGIALEIEYALYPGVYDHLCAYDTRECGGIKISPPYRDAVVCSLNDGVLFRV